MNQKRLILNKTIPGSLQRSREIGRVVEELEALPAERSWRIEIEDVKSERSLQQNKYLFGVAYELISKATGYEKNDLHDDLLGKHFGTRLKRVPKSKYVPHGVIEIPIRTTTTDEHGRRSVLGKMQFAEFVSFVQRYAAEAGVVVPDPDPNWRQQLHRQEQAA